MKCTERDHKHHEIVSIEKESKRVKMIKEKEIQRSIQFVDMVMSAIKRNQDLLIQEIKQKQEAAEKKAQELLDELSQEINELERRRNELHDLEHITNPLHLLQSCPSLSVPMYTRDWSEVRVHSDNYIGTVRSAFSKLKDVCQELEKKLSAQVDVTLDPATAAGWLVLSPDGKKVSLSFSQKRLSVPDDPRRFDSCVSVLGKQSFTSGRRYWVVQTLLRQTNSNMQQLILARLRKVETIKHSMDLSKNITEKEIQSSAQVCKMLISAIEKHQAGLLEELKQKQEEAEMTSNELLDELQKEINDLQMRSSELQHLELSQSLLHLLQSMSLWILRLLQAG
ncbi:hypothetical protein PAMP_015922 [Pampus punctatissimus]